MGEIEQPWVSDHAFCSSLIVLCEGAGLACLSKVADIGQPYSISVVSEIERGMDGRGMELRD
jgi:hypothetical protein